MAISVRTSKASALAPSFELDLPPFPGFGKAGFKFLKELKQNNVREWFTPERKAIYQDNLLEPMRLLLGELATRFREEHLPYTPDAKQGVFRIYRDVRFSKDKSPFKTHLGAMAPFRNMKDGTGNYIHIEPGACFYGGGAYMLESTALRNLRAALADDPDAFRRIAAKLEKDFGPLRGDKLKRGPAGYAKDHPAIDLLLYTQLWTSTPFPDKLAMSRELVDWIVDKSRAILDFNEYLYNAIKG